MLSSSPEGEGGRVKGKVSRQNKTADRSFSFAKSAIYTVFLWIVFLLGAEGLLWIIGAPTLIERQDPSRGFSGLVPVFVQDGQSMRTQPLLRSEVFNDQSFAVSKPDDGLRIFTVGGSSAFGFPWGASASFSGVLQDVLTQAYPDRDIEVVNAAGVSYAMQRLNLVVRELVQYEPDVLIVYSGHNEFVEHDFFESLRERSVLSNRFIHAASQLRIFGALDSILVGLGIGRAPVEEDFSMVVDRADQVWDSPTARAAVIDNFRDGLIQLVRTAHEHGTKVLVATVPCNFRNWRPQRSVVGEFADDSQRTAWQEAYAAGQSYLATGQFRQAAAELEYALELAPRHADTHFLLGHAYEELGQWELSHQSFERAVDHDATPIRRLSQINSAIREVSTQEGALLVDVEEVFKETSEHGLVGFELIEDYVHPSREGHSLIAWNLWREMAEAQWIDGVESADRAVFDRVVAMRPSVTSNRNAVWHYNQGVILENQDHFQEAIAKYRQAIEIDPDYWGALQNLGLLLRQQGEADEALQIMRRAVALRPEQVDSLLPYADLLRSTGYLDEALETFQQIATHSNEAAAHLGIGQVYERMGSDDEAAMAFEQAIVLEPESARPHILLGHLMVRNGDMQRAETHVMTAVRLDPLDADAHNALGVLHSALDRLDDAAAAFARSAQLRPTHATAYHNLSRVQLLQGDLDQAQSNLDIAIRIDPELSLVHFTQGQIYSFREMWQEAATQYRLALERQPDFGPAQQAYRQALARLGVAE